MHPATFFVELGAVVLSLGILARLAGIVGLSPVPFYLLAGPQGDQIAVTVAAKPDKLKAIGNRDMSLVNSIDFSKK